LICVKSGKSECADISNMMIRTFRTLLLATIIGAVGVWAFVPSVAVTHARAGAAEMHAAKGQDATAADCAGVVAHGACCAASTVACCASCLLLPTEFAAAAPRGTPVFAAALDGTAAGLPPATLKRPPRLAR
jgi:hypothetical protein